ncbi:MAG: flagellin [Phycisphaerales bacterium]
MISARTNMGSFRAVQAMNDAGWRITKTLQRLSSGKRINSAADDPAGMMAVTSLKSSESGLNAEIKSLQQRQFGLDATEGALTPITDMLHELNALVVTSANTSGMSSDERNSLQVQADSILATLDYLGNTTEFKGARILTGVNAAEMGQITYTTGDDPQQKSGTLLDLRRGGSLDLMKGDNAAAQKAVQAALKEITTRRASIGAESNSIDSMISAKQVELENTAAARGQIEDADYAQETANLVREQTRQQAAVYVAQLAQQQRATVVLDLLKGLTNK